LAVYEEIMIRVKNHHNPATMRVDVALKFFNEIKFFFLIQILKFKYFFFFNLGMTSLPCCISDPIVNHMAFKIVKLFSKISGCCRHGCGLFHSYGVILQVKEEC
jgi:hypothetical protein